MPRVAMIYLKKMFKWLSNSCFEIRADAQVLEIGCEMALPKRFSTDVLILIFPSRSLSIRCWNLHFRRDWIHQYGHVFGEEVITDITPHRSIAFFKTLGYEVTTHLPFFKRLMARYEPVIVYKLGFLGGEVEP